MALDGKGQGAKSTSAGGDGEGCTLEGFLAEVILKWRPEGSIGISQEGEKEKETAQSIASAKTGGQKQCEASRKLQVSQSDQSMERAGAR